MATRLFLHAATDSTTGLPTAEQSSLTATNNAEGSQTTNRVMDTTTGVLETSLNVTIAGSAIENNYYTRFVTASLNMSSLSANTWTYNFAAREDDTSNHFPTNGTNGPIRINCYVWRPSSSTKVGTVLDGNSASTIDEGGANDKLAHHVTFTGAAVASMTAGDVLIFEMWCITDSAASVGPECRMFFDGTTVNTTDNAAVTNHASFLETPENLSFGAAAAPEDARGARPDAWIPQIWQKNNMDVGLSGLIGIVRATMLRHISEPVVHNFLHSLPLRSVLRDGDCMIQSARLLPRKIGSLVHRLSHPYIRARALSLMDYQR